ncbi:E3 ubiquitin-protein ligase synoviolin [Homalodisca vitripennis]|nr:E3 ubiquitin-protein ligase synoviolin [Homalodisca vitripennis]
MIYCAALLILLAALDLDLLAHAYQSTISKGASVQLVFGFEYAILLTIIANIAIKYTLHTIALHSDNPWENKAVFLLYTELIMGFFKVVLYILFMAIMIRISMLPLFAFRPMYYTMRAFKKAFNDVILSRRAIRNMNTLYPDATPEELAAADNVCIICREEMVTGQSYTCYICTLYILMPHLRSLQLQTTSVSSVERKWSQVSHILVKYEHSVS